MAFKFDLEKEVAIFEEKLKGIIIGRSEVIGCSDQYLVRFQCEDADVFKSHWYDEEKVVAAMYLR